MTSGIDPKFFNEVSQFAHFGMACSIYLAVGHVLQHFSGWFSWYWFGPFIVVGVALAAWKEFVYDAKDENPDTRGSDLEDFSFYMLGIGVAIALLALWRRSRGQCS